MCWIYIFLSHWGFILTEAICKFNIVYSAWSFFFLFQFHIWFVYSALCMWLFMYNPKIQVLFANYNIHALASSLLLTLSTTLMPTRWSPGWRRRSHLSPVTTMAGMKPLPRSVAPCIGVVREGEVTFQSGMRNLNCVFMYVCHNPLYVHNLLSTLLLCLF